ncbi:hypothetical protein ACH4XT_31015 [Streptomyces avidinii]|uniref:hypothetical protein n=1 Tax=Streptomyces avidinii TaxID=1895 RepID=UPI0037AFF31E
MTAFSGWWIRTNASTAWQPDLLLPQLIAAGVLHPDGEYARPESESYRDRDRLTLALIESRFGLVLPRDAVVGQRLPAFLIR